jgi:glycerol-3-phosphate O-acyltransferase
MTRSLTKTYAPNPLLRMVYERFFDKIRVDEAWIQSVTELSKRGSIVYVLRNLNFVDFFALDHLTKRYGLPQVRFVNDLGLGMFNPISRGSRNSFITNRLAKDENHLGDALQDGGSAMLFLKRPPGPLDVVGGGASGGRGLREGEDLMRGLIDLQRDSDEPILLVPQVIIWTKRPDTLGTRPMDFILGPREWPGTLRTIGQFLQNYKNVALKVGEPFDLQDFVAKNPKMSEDTQVRRVTYAMLRRLERERRAITGPAQKPPDRVRHEIVRSPKLREVITELAGERPQEQAVLTARALGMLREIQATPDIGTVKMMDMVLDRVFERIYAGIEFDPKDLDRLREGAKEGTLILLPSHKSHIDYLVLSYLFMHENLQLPLIAAGENLSFFPLGPVFRRGGAFFLRRSFKGDRLYVAVMDAYVRRVIRDGFPIELFVEGGRSRSGKLLPPKFGLLSMIVDAALKIPQRKVFFVPVSIGYERVIEAGEYQQELSGGEKKKEDAKGLLGATEVLRYKYGRINLQIGSFITLGDVRKELDLPAKGDVTDRSRLAMTRRLGNLTMDEINRITAVTPGALSALALLSDDRRGIPHDELMDRCRRLLAVLRDMGARVTPTLATAAGTLKSQAIDEALQMFGDADLLDIHDMASGDSGKRKGRRKDKNAPRAGEGAIYSVIDKQRVPLDTTKNMIVHFFVERSLVATAMQMNHGVAVDRATVKERVFNLSRIFKFEFRFRADAPFDEIFDDTVNTMIRANELEDRRGQLAPGIGHNGWSGKVWLTTYQSILHNFVEGYVMAARSLAALVKGGPLPKKDLVKRALSAGRRGFLGGEHKRPESVSKPLVENAFRSFVDQKYLKETDGKLELVTSFRTPEAVDAIAGRISAFLGNDDSDTQ